MRSSTLVSMSRGLVSREEAREIDAQLERVTPEVDALLDGNSRELR
jgi:hypothetical protein